MTGKKHRGACSMREMFCIWIWKVITQVSAIVKTLWTVHLRLLHVKESIHLSLKLNKNNKIC